MNTNRPDDEAVLSDEERKTIASLRRLAKRWPRSLTLASMGGTLVVFRTSDERWGADWGGDRADAVIADDFDGIPNDGGDW